MKGAITYALFLNESVENQPSGIKFHSFLRGLLLNLRLNRLIYPEWTTVVQLDKNVYAKYFNFFNKLTRTPNFEIRINESEPLTKAMLWRLKPCFEVGSDGFKVWDYVLCRDLDSPTTYRDAQAVKYWMNRDKAAHAITDSISHDVPMLGGMIGFIPKYFTEKVGQKEWGAMFYGVNIDFSRKGADQDFLTQYIYPKFAQHGSDSITQHYLKGMPDSFLSDCHNKIQDLELDIPFDMKESNNACVHLGQAGWNETGLFDFLLKHWHKFDDLLEIESEYADIFHWVNTKN